MLADKACSSRAIREHLRMRGIRAVIPVPADQRGHRLRRGRRGARPPAFDREAYKQRNTVERCCRVRPGAGRRGFGEFTGAAGRTSNSTGAVSPLGYSGLRLLREERLGCNDASDMWLQPSRSFQCPDAL